MGHHDLSYRAFFVHQQMIQGLLQEILEDRWVERVDLGSGERFDTSFVSPKHENRESDIIWKFRRADGGEPVHVYLLLEFQSRPDPSMPVRFMGYESFFYQALLASQPATGWRNLPLVILTWLKKVVAPRFRVTQVDLDAIQTLEDFRAMLAENIDRWNREIWEEGRQEGLQEGRQEGLQEGWQEGEARVVLRLLRLKFGPLESEVEDRVRIADADRLLEWSERILTAESLQDVFGD